MLSVALPAAIALSLCSRNRRRHWAALLILARMFLPGVFAYRNLGAGKLAGTVLLEELSYRRGSESRFTSRFAQGRTGGIELKTYAGDAKAEFHENRSRRLRPVHCRHSTYARGGGGVSGRGGTGSCEGCAGRLRWVEANAASDALRVTEKVPGIE